MIKLHYIEGYIQQIYLAEYADKLMLLDGCSRADTKTLVHYITQVLNRPMTDLKLVVVTHMHPDHAGAANYLRKHYRCKIAAANVAGQWYAGFDGKLMHWADMLLTLWVAGKKRKAKQNIYYASSLTPDIYLTDHGQIPGFEDWQVIFTQGHTDRCISLLHRASGQIYVADLIVKVRDKLIAPYPVFYPKRYQDSLTKVQGLAAKHIILAHGGKISLNASQWQQLHQHAPTKPITHWRSVKTKLKRAFFSR